MILSKASLFIKLISLHVKKTIENNVKNDRLEVSFSTKNDLERTTPFVENERTFGFFVLALFGTKRTVERFPSLYLGLYSSKLDFIVTVILSSLSKDILILELSSISNKVHEGLPSGPLSIASLSSINQ